MKKFIAMILVLLLALSTFGALAASKSILINKKNFPDPSFRGMVGEPGGDYDINGDGKLSASEIKKIDWVHVVACDIGSLTGKVSTSFVLDTLTFMWKGGRCSGVTALGANLLKLKPALRMHDGKLEVFKKYRGNINHVYKQYVSEMLEGKKIRPGHIFITESGEVDHAVIGELTDLVKRLSGCQEVHHTFAGCTVSSHCGPKTLGVLFIEE